MWKSTSVGDKKRIIGNILSSVLCQFEHMCQVKRPGSSSKSSRKLGVGLNWYCSASEVRHLHFMTILKSFYCPVTAYMYTLPLKQANPFI